ncbi:nucleotide pyrophosphohydrolase [Corynebacterium crudilactis]|uniref:Nucleotide pyrophosphohydrolase n=1 Tax=Corynebacterium crudilactis TaxID=1652495 RepID=A0A172QWT4_9CORY|nr:nucleotide pyrophosphohydrolase [Corynebacterium crudilactis]ANE05172.1 nucleotide pyrophosphohydrolase [Corynebacterium crudilactis]
MNTEQVLAQLQEFAKDRDWGKFHTSENLAKSISIEAAELLECFQWSGDFDNKDVRHELADVLTYCYFLAMKLDVDPNDIILEKLQITKEKYPVEQAYGKANKYDQL